MPKYKYALTNGKHLVLEGDNQPSDTEVESHAKEQNVILSLAENTVPSDIPSSVDTPIPQTEEKVTSDSEKPPERGWLSKAWHTISDPLTDAPSRFAKSIGDYIDSPSLERSPTMASIQGFGAGAIQGIGDLVSGLTSPINFATAALSGGSSLAAKSGLPAIARGLSLGSKIAAAPMVAHGGMNVVNPESSMMERGFGLAEMAGGGAAMLHSPGIQTPEPLPVKKPNLSRVAESVVKKPEVVDPNFNQGIGDAELAGSIPYKTPTKPRYRLTDGKLVPIDEAVKSPEVAESTLPSETSTVNDNQLRANQQSTARLSKDLQGAKPRFNVGTDSYIPAFESDIDKALFIIAQKKPSLKNADYLKFVMTETGMSNLESMEAGINVRSMIKAALKGQEPGEVKISTIWKPKSEPVVPENGIPRAPEQFTQQVNEASTGNILPPSPEASVGGTPPPIDPRTQALLDKRGEGPSVPPIDKSGKLQSGWDLSRGLMSVDPPYMTSAAFRQASPFAGTTPWFKAWNEAKKSYGSKAAAKLLNDSILEKPLFKPISLPDGKVGPSYAEARGLKIGDLSKYGKRDEAIRGELAERIPGYGRHVAGSNRAFNAFLNKVSTDNFESLITDAVKLNRDGKAGGITGNLFTNKPVPNPLEDLVFGEKIAEFVNTALKRGKLSAEAGSHEINLEKNARLLANTFFSPRTISSNIRMLNPSTYIMADPFIRKQYLTSMIRQVGTWWTIAGLAAIGGASVSKNPTSADFGKIKIGNTRIDVPGGLQQYLVLGARSIAGGTTSTESGQFKPFGQGYKPETIFSTALKFLINRFHPSLKTGVDLTSATQKQPFHVADRTVQMAAPMFMDDLMDVLKQNPELSPLILGASGAGMGTQSYERGSYGKPTFVPEKYDWNIGARK